MKKLITDYLEESAKRLPDKVVYRDPDRSVTFSEIRQESRRLAQVIIDRGLHKKPIAVFLDKSINCISALYAVAYSGNFYTVLDTEMPAERIHKILGTLKPELILTDQAHHETVRDMVGDIAMVTVEEAESVTVNESALREVYQKTQTTDLMYVLFTSGSTGTPKGVTTSHSMYIHYLEGAQKVYRIEEDEVFLNQVPFYFVMAGTDIYAPAMCGCSMHIIPKTYYSFPLYLMKYIEENHCSFLYWVPSALSMIVRTKAFDVADISSVRKIVFGGEVMLPQILREWKKQLPDCMMINGYGSTEITDGALYYEIDRDFPDGATLPIGRPYPNADIMVVGDDGKIVEPQQVGVIGEVYVRGPSVSYGYYGDPERTAEAFVQNPLHNNYREIVYCMGDLVRYNQYGELEYVGRSDFQIKHMGQRIELGEIESNAAGVAGVEENACFYDTEKQKIVMFYTGSIESKELGKKLKELLPPYMLPGKRIKLEEMPHNLNGKIDRGNLKNRLGE